MKTWICNSVILSLTPSKHRGSNGNFQYTVLIRAKTKKRVAEILGCNYRTLTSFYGCHDVSNFNDKVKIVKKDETIYYKVEHTKTEYLGQWFEYQPETSK